MRQLTIESRAQDWDAASPPDWAAAALGHPVLLGCDPNRVQAVLRRLRPRRLPRGALLHSPDSPQPRLHLVLDGQLRLFHVTSHGRRVLLPPVEPGGFDGILSLGGHSGHFSEVDRPAFVLSLTREDLERLMEAEPRVAINLVWLLTSRLHGREEQVNLLALRNPTLRLARQLLALAGGDTRTEVSVGRNVTHQALADMLGLRRETVTIHLHALARQGAVRQTRAGLLIVPAALTRIAEGSQADSSASG